MNGECKITLKEEGSVKIPGKEMNTDDIGYLEIEGTGKKGLSLSVVQYFFKKKHRKQRKARCFLDLVQMQTFKQSRHHN